MNFIPSPVNRLMLSLAMVSLACTYGVSAYAANDAIQFSAHAIQTLPGKKVRKAHMYVGSDAVRTEFYNGGKQVVEILHKGKGMRIALFPAQRDYVKTRVKKSSITLPGAQKEIRPCAGMSGVECKLLGNEKINGMQTEKWEFSGTRQGRTIRTLHWIDVARRLPMREIFPDGTVSELRQLADKKIAGRNTEKWELTITRPDGKSTRSFQWYDPELKITIREELPGGLSREIKNIKVGKQPPHLFEIPPGFQERVSQPARQGLAPAYPAAPRR